MMLPAEPELLLSVIFLFQYLIYLKNLTLEKKIFAWILEKTRWFFNLFTQQLGAKITKAFRAALLSLRFYNCHVMYFVNPLGSCLSFLLFRLSEWYCRPVVIFNIYIQLGGVTDGTAV